LVDSWSAARRTSSCSTTASTSSEWSCEGKNVSLADPSSDSGSLFRSEIAEQPAALRRLAASSDAFAGVVDNAQAAGATLVRLVGHGSSDNAASFGVYAFGLLPQWTAFRDSISLTVNLGSRRDMHGSLVVALSQSGRTPDVVEYVERAREQGAFTVGITNHLDSQLAGVAHEVLDLAAGTEQAVAATKTYVNQVASLALLAAHAAGEGPRYTEGLLEVADLLDDYIPELEAVMPAIAIPFAFVGRMFVIGRGPEFATAREIALKLLETCYVAAEPLTATDLAHGPIAAVDPLFPVWAIASDGEMLAAVTEAAARIRAAGATIVASGTAAEAIDDARYVLRVPRPSLPLLAPLLSVVPGQVFAGTLARAKGHDPDHPRGLSKVTLAQ
jgi:glucosamine--fructose-6-phosphate aminotransferase (isomerizing)